VLIIRQSQLEAFEAAAMQRFAQRCNIFLRDSFKEWSQDKTEEDLGRFVQAMLQFSSKHGISREKNILKMMELKIHYDFSLPLPERLQNVLLPIARDEDYRMLRFSKALGTRESELIRIHLGSDAQLLRRKY